MSEELANAPVREVQDLPIRPSPAGRFLRLSGWFSLLVLVTGIAYFFYFHGYRFAIANSSYSSTVELVRRKIVLGRGTQTLVLGNSAAAEGFPASHYNKLSGTSAPAINLGVPSGHMFLYEKILSMALDAGIQPKAVVLVVTPEILTFSFSPYYNYLTNDLSVLKVELDLQDAALLRHHTQSLFQQLEYTAPLLLRPALFTADLRDLVSHPVQRYKDAVFVSGWLNSLTTLESFPEPDNAYTVCQAEPLEELGKRLESERQKADNPNLADLERVWSGYDGRANAAQFLKVDAFETERLRSLLERFAQRVPSVFLAPAPFYDPRFTQLPAQYREDFMSEITRFAEGNPAIHVLPAFQADCTLMMDTVHLNRKGGELFSEYLHEQVESIVGAHAPNSNTVGMQEVAGR